MDTYNMKNEFDLRVFWIDNTNTVRSVSFRFEHVTMREARDRIEYLLIFWVIVSSTMTPALVLQFLGDTGEANRNPIRDQWTYS
jgi:hypothetical protein